MVPTRPIRGEDESQEEYEERLDRDYNDISPIKGIFKSFSDAPGGFKEELQEIQWSLGLEYTYHEQFSICIRLIYHFNFLCFFQIDVFISDPVSVFYICDKTLSGFAGHIWKINFFIGSSQ